MTEAVREAQEQSVVWDVFELEGSTHLEAETAADEDKRDVLEGMGVSFSEFVGPEDGGIVEERAVSIGFWGIGELLGEVGNLLAVPGVDFGELLDGLFVRIRFVGKSVVILFDSQPSHFGLADRVGELEGEDTCEVGLDCMEHQVGLHAGQGWDVVVAIFDFRIQRGNCMVIGGTGGKLFFKFADEGFVFVEQASIVLAYIRAKFRKIGLQVVEDASDTLLVFALSVEFVEHRVGVIDWGDGSVGTFVDHTCPGVGSTWNTDTEFEGAETGLGFGSCLEVFFDFLVDGDSAGPACRGIRTPLDISWVEFDACQQAAHSPHVVIAIASNFIADTVEGKQSIFEGSQGSHDRFEIELISFLVGPEIRWDHAVGAEHDDQPLFSGRGAGMPEAAEVQ